MQSLLPHFPDQRHLSSLQDCRRCLGTYSIPNRIRSSLSRNHRNSARIHWCLSRTHWSLNRNHRSSARKNFHPSFPIPKASFPYRLSNRRNPTGHSANRFRSPVHFRNLHCFHFPNWNPPPRSIRSGFPRLLSPRQRDPAPTRKRLQPSPRSERGRRSIRPSKP